MPKVTREHIERRKAEILEAAKRVFIKKGYEPTTMQDVVNESGMSRGNVYRYFSNTEEMFLEVRRQSAQGIQQEIDEALEEHRTVWEALDAVYLKGYLTGQEQRREDPESDFGKVVYEYSVTSWRNDSHKRAMLDYYYKNRDIFVAFLKKGVERGEFTPVQPLEAIVNFMFNVTDGLILQTVIVGSEDGIYVREQIEGLRMYLRSVLQVESAE